MFVSHRDGFTSPSLTLLSSDCHVWVCSKNIRCKQAVKRSLSKTTSRGHTVLTVLLDKPQVQSASFDIGTSKKQNGLESFVIASLFTRSL